MRTIDEVYLATNTPDIAFGESKKKEIKEFFSGDPTAKKTTPTIARVPMSELELTYLHNPTIFNGINKIVQTIMSAEHELICPDKKVKTYFENFLANLGNSGADISWEDLLSQIYKFQCIYGKSFTENIFNKKHNRIVDWDLIDPKKMDYAKDSSQLIALDKYGKPIGYTETLPYNYDSPAQELPPIITNRITLPPNGLFMYPDQVAQIKLFTIGDGFYPIGLIEPIYTTSLRKLNIEEAMANAIWRHGFPIILAAVGDMNHEPTPQQIKSLLSKVKDINYKQEMAVPYYYDLKILESKKSEKLREHLEYFREQEIAGLGIPKPFATGGGEACYSEDTMTFTENGWKYHYEIEKDEKIATFNPDTKELEFHNYHHKEVFRYKGKMHHYKSSVFDILVTPKHKMYYRTENKDEWLKKPSEDITEECIRFTNSVRFNNGIDASDMMYTIPKIEYEEQAHQKTVDSGTEIRYPIKSFLKFLGFYISEGWCGIKDGHYPVEISNLDPVIISEMKDCLEVLGLKWRCKISRGRIEGVRFNDKSLAIWLKRCCGESSQDIKIPEGILNLKPELLEILLDSLIKGDGSTWGTTGISYYTSSKKLFSQICELMMKCGYAVNFNDYIKDKNVAVYRINGNKTHLEPRVRRSKHLTEVEYDGVVYCYEVPNHLYITSRNGKITIQGNTNRATLGNQSGMFQLTLRDIIDKTIEAIRRYMFKPICDLEGFKVVPTLKWDVIGADELDNKAKRIISYIKAGVLSPEEVQSFIKKIEKLE